MASPSTETVDNNPGGVKQYDAKSAMTDAANITLTHPMGLVKTLIQLGHEPMPNYSARAWLPWKYGTFKPGLLPYMLHIARQDGVFGLWRGVTPRLTSSLIFNFTRQFTETTLSAKLPDLSPCPATEKEDWSSGYQLVARSCIQKSIAETIAVLASHPFQVLAVRSMAQFISRETAYDNLLSSIIEIKDNEGLSGFFKGVVPRLVGAIIGIVIIESLSFTVKKGVDSLDEDVKREQKDLFEMIKNYCGILSGIVAGTFSYPYYLTSTIMSTNGSRLQCATYENNWSVCLKDLKALKEHQRGSSIWFGRSVKVVMQQVAAFALWANHYSTITPSKY